MPKIPPPSFEEADDEPLDREDARELRLTALFSKAMAGALTGARAKKYWERKTLSPRHLRIIQMRAAGFKNYEISEAMGMSQSSVSIILKQPASQTILAELVSIAADDVLDVRTRIKASAGEMLETVLETTRNTRNEKLKSENAFKLLGMAGYGAVEKKQIDVVAKVEGAQAERLMRTLDEMAEAEGEEIDSEGRFTMLASEAVEAEETEPLEVEEQLVHEEPSADEAAA